eukprot:CAMPEP_0172429132 /NCGR_PEP_ID=MMETSP1064-20121228/49211_1 /TAXON_ID=202472 /ORGANISM="Aulacoseira subarctica , Strain CCAP 1002/5" /LENGTH=333 /DNA_ID=CAMNT_0013174335 /DNA_START=8 /DNA_END=1009 /DNA_ORIENTATION=-
MKLGFSLSPGGLLFPYHLGVLSSLEHRGYITDQTPLAGSSAGAIAVASHAARVDPMEALNGCIRISEQCMASGGSGGARGRLMNLLEKELDDMLPHDAHTIVNNRDGLIGFAWKEIFPLPTKNVLATKFNNREDFIEAVVNSSMFPFFTSNLPFVVRRSSTISKQKKDKEEDKNIEFANMETLDNKDYDTDSTSPTEEVARPKKLILPVLTLPRLVVDGFFTVPRQRFGCPIFPPHSGVDREVTVSVFPHDTIGLTASEPHNQISPILEEGEDSATLLQMLFQAAVNPSTAREHERIFERGYRDAIRWADEEDRRRAEVNDFFMSNLQVSPFV